MSSNFTVAPRARSKKITASSNNIPIAFDATAGSLALGSLYNKGYSSMMVLNETDTRIAIVTAGPGDAVPGPTTDEKVFVLAKGTGSFDRFPILDSIYVQSDDGSPIVAGTVEIMVW